MESNFLVKIIAGVAVTFLVLLGVFALRGDDVSDETQTQVQAADPVDGLVGVDINEPVFGNAEIIISDQDLQAKFGADLDDDEAVMRELLLEFKQIRLENAQLATENKELKANVNQLMFLEDRIINNVSKKVDRVAIDAEQNNTELQSSINESQSILDGLRVAYDDLKLNQKPNSSTSAGDYTVNGFDSADLGYTANGSMIDNSVIEWQMPLDAKVNSQGQLQLPKISMAGIGTNPVANIAEPLTGNRNGDLTKEERSIKAYTLPQNSTLFGSVSMTALLGRIPIGGVVNQPYPFKIIVGKDNLSSNGINIPGLDGIKMSGIASGDWMLSCVSGEIRSMTFTFDDGTIVTYPEPQEGSTQTTSNEALAWFSDESGVPCITGERLTNAKEYLSQRIGLGAIGAWANAKVQGEYSNTTTATGGSISSLVGNPTTVARNAAISGGVDEVGQWLRDRQDNAFDAVYVPPGTGLIVHMMQQVKIDYDPQGRKVHYQENFNQSNIRGLD